MAAQEVEADKTGYCQFSLVDGPGCHALCAVCRLTIYELVCDRCLEDWTLNERFWRSAYRR